METAHGCEEVSEVGEGGAFHLAVVVAMAVAAFAGGVGMAVASRPRGGGMGVVFIPGIVGMGVAFPVGVVGMGIGTGPLAAADTEREGAQEE